jgi:hypothetical protein
MFPVKAEGEENGLLGVCEAVGSAEAAQGWGWSSETTVDQTLIRGLDTAFRVFVSGLSSVLGAGVGRTGSAT